MKVKIVIKKKALLNAIPLILNNRKSKSDFLNISFNIGNLKYAINKVAAAFIPPEFEKKSIEIPNKKLSIKNVALFFLIGNKNIQTMYTKGFKCPKKLIWFKTKTCNRTKLINRTIFIKINLFIYCCLFKLILLFLL